MASTWQSIAARKQDERTSRIPPAWRLDTFRDGRILDTPRRSGILSDLELAITEEFDATGLLGKLANGSFKSEQVVLAFCKRAAIAQQVTNCLTEVLFQDALERARQLDQQFEKSGQPVGPLHGLPISLKDTFKIRGYDSSLGLASLCFNPATANSALVDQLLSLGAVLYCKTNVPQTMMALDSHNNVFGRTLNPSNTDLTAGGSSGGEGALIAMRGSILGVGTDVGGSIRIPALCNGLFGVKPSHGRVPFAGQEGGQKPGASKLGIEAVAGPLATSVRDCTTFMRAIADAGAEILDPEVVAQPWDLQPALRTVTEKPLRIGIVRTDGHVQPLPPIVRLVEEVAQTLKVSSQHPIQVIEVDASSIFAKVLKPFNGMMSIDGANAWFGLLEPTGEPLSPWLQGRLSKRPQKSLDEVRKLQAQKTELQTAFLKVWDEDGGYWCTDASEAMIGRRTLDALIMPVAPHPVSPIDRWNTVNYTGALNLLDLPAGIVPVRRFRQSDLHGEIPDTKPLNGWDKINRELWTKVDRNVYLDSPLSVQIVTPRLTERRLVEVMAVVDKALEPLRKRRDDSRL